MEYNITYRKKDKGIQAIISYKDVTGKWKQKSKQGFKTQKEAKPIVSKMIRELEKSLLNKKGIISQDYKSITFKELSDMFIEHSLLYKEYNTVMGYKNAIYNLKSIFDIKVFELKRNNITKCIDNMVSNGLKKSTITMYLRRIKLIFDYYKENYYSDFSIDLKFKMSADKDNNKRALNRSELNNLFNNDKLKNSKYYIVAFIAANTGLRCCEILGLTWNDINEKTMKINVDKQWKILKSGKNGFGTLKTKNSYRQVPISLNILSELKKYKSLHPISIDNRIAPFAQCSINQYLNPLLIELSGITLHELRHTYITMLVSAGLDFKTVAMIAGHDVEQTFKTYSHVTSDMIENASNTISKIF